MDVTLEIANEECEYDPTKEEMENHRKMMKERDIIESEKCLRKLFKEKESSCCCGRCDIKDDLDYCCARIYPENIKYQGSMGRLVSKKLDDEFWKGQHNRCLVDCEKFEKYLNEETLRIFKSGYKFAIGVLDNDWKATNFRFYAYSLFVADLNIKLKNKRLPLPSCVIKKVREKWPSSSYTGFLSGFAFNYEED